MTQEVDVWGGTADAAVLDQVLQELRLQLVTLPHDDQLKTAQTTSADVYKHLGGTQQGNYNSFTCTCIYTKLLVRNLKYSCIISKSDQLIQNCVTMSSCMTDIFLHNFAKPLQSINKALRRCNIDLSYDMRMRAEFSPLDVAVARLWLAWRVCARIATSRCPAPTSASRNNQSWFKLRQSARQSQIKQKTNI